MTDVFTESGIQMKPSTILEYNSFKSYIDVSDQMAAYDTTLSESPGRAAAANNIKACCVGCSDQLYMCLGCLFFEKHSC